MTRDDRHLLMTPKTAAMRLAARIESGLFGTGPAQRVQKLRESVGAGEGGRAVSHAIAGMKCLECGGACKATLVHGLKSWECVACGLDGLVGGEHEAAWGEARRPDLEALRRQKDDAYAQRNELAACLARAVLAVGGTAGLRQHDPTDTSWEPDWRTILMVDLPSGQASWHFHDSERHLLEGLPDYPREWDGHDTPEKRERVKRAFKGDW